MNILLQKFTVAIVSGLFWAACKKFSHFIAFHFCCSCSRIANGSCLPQIEILLFQVRTVDWQVFRPLLKPNPCGRAALVWPRQVAQPLAGISPSNPFVCRLASVYCQARRWHFHLKSNTLPGYLLTGQPLGSPLCIPCNRWLTEGSLVWWACMLQAGEGHSFELDIYSSTGWRVEGILSVCLNS